ncbi:MAG TPA: hypothetical protein VGG49_13285 [Steroidobacteraceae bacterium]|jgi:hypothetical protein
MATVEPVPVPVAELLEKIEKVQATAVNLITHLQDERDQLREVNTVLVEALEELIPIAEHGEYPEGDHPAVGRAREALRKAGGR